MPLSVGALLVSLGLPAPVGLAPVHPPSPVIADVELDHETLRELAPGSDNWVITWADDGHQYTCWGDGGGFGGTNTLGRVSLGVGRVEGPADAYQGFNVWGGFEPENPAQFEGKAYGILSIGPVLYLWRAGDGSEAGNFAFSELYRSLDHGASWQVTGVRWEPDDFPASEGFFVPTFLQFGQAYDGARDGFVYVYAPENQDGVWEVQVPGEISLLRAPVAEIENPAAWELFAGLAVDGEPTWTADPGMRSPVFADPVHGVMRTSVGYNAGLGRYHLITQQVSRFQAGDGHIGIYDAPEPWGPWTTVLFESPWELGLQTGHKTVYWNFSNKWASADGRDFVLVYTGAGADSWGTMEGSFLLRDLFADGFESGDASRWSTVVD